MNFNSIIGQIFNKVLETRMSEFTRNQGNEEFKKGNYRNSLICYNVALMKAEGTSNLKAALCYGNRSAAFLEMGYFSECLHNIDLALAVPDYPESNVKRLQERRQKCLKLMRRVNKEPKSSLSPFSKLSYDANTKMPFFISSIEMIEDSKYGRHLITTSDLKSGDVIALFDESSSIFTMNLENHAWACYNCSKVNNLDLIPVEGCDDGEEQKVQQMKCF